MASILIVDDLLSIHEMLDAVIQPTGFATAFATDGEMALTRYRSEPFDVVLADIDMKPVDGITLLKQLKVHDPNCAVIIMTAYASTESAILALKYGAFDYLQKPFRVDELIATLKRALEFRRQSIERASQTTAPAARAQGFEQRLVGRSAKAMRLLQQVRKLAAVRTPVLLQGEPGSGRSTVAEILHEASVGTDAPLVRIDCSLSSEANFRAGLLGENGLGGNWVASARGAPSSSKICMPCRFPCRRIWSPCCATPHTGSV
jgi:two-component system response regulator HydG